MLPSKPGAYIFKNEKGDVIYVGKAKDLKKRVSSYFSNKSLDNKTILLVKEISSIDHIIVRSEVEALLLEANLIKKYKPFYNIKLSDDKSFPFIKISSDKIPYVSISRNKNEKKSIYFGPYTDAYALKVVLKLLRKIFPFQTTKNHLKKKCFYYHLNLCPCATADNSNIEKYKKNIKLLKKFLNGNAESVLKSLAKTQNEYIKKEEFERAKDIQVQIEKINIITSENYDPFRYQEVPDFYFQRIRKELDSLKEILNKYHLKVNSLERIECYDISNIQGKDATGSMVVFLNGDSSKKDYRKFKIRRIDTPDDFLMHKEMMTRRIKHAEWTIPNLIVIDGGRGQVSSVLQVLKEASFDVPLIGLAKREETIVIPEIVNSSVEFIEVNLSNSTPGINLLRRIRDEAHRFAITYHRLLRKKRHLNA